MFKAKLKDIVSRFLPNITQLRYNMFKPILICFTVQRINYMKRALFLLSWLQKKGEQFSNTVGKNIELKNIEHKSFP